MDCLDGAEISRSERIQAAQGLEEARRRVQQQEQEYLKKRAQEKEEAQRKKGGEKAEKKERKAGFDGRWYTDINSPGTEENKENPAEEQDMKPNVDEEQQEREFWEKPCSFSPESRLETHRYLEEKRKAKEKEKEKKPKAPRTLITADGRVMNVNEPKLDFCLTEDEDRNTVVLDLAVYRHMDSSLLDVDVQTTYVRVNVKGKQMFQLVLPAEVKPDSSTAQRSQTTGHLLLTMPRAEGEIKVSKVVSRPTRTSPNASTPQENKRNVAGRERLEVDPSKHVAVNVADIIPRQRTKEGPLETSRMAPPTATGHISFSAGFVDNPDVPPLI
ncbi:hypothetical protein LDENG_00077110 [Lucifuga dentata]|nr:hypothetical protein LDENG_00077110 [Lucifuga dentata]